MEGLLRSVSGANGADVRERSFEDLYRDHGSEALRLAYLLVGDLRLAEDLSQEAFVKLLGRFQNLRRREAFRAYLLKTVVNLARSHGRRQQRERVYLRAETFRVEQFPDLSGYEDLLRTLSELPMRQRAALVLRYFEDLSEHETAELMSTTTKAVKSLVTRGLAKMRSIQEVRAP